MKRIKQKLNQVLYWLKIKKRPIPSGNNLRELSYSMRKDDYVKFNKRGVKKIKLRKYVSQLSTSLIEFNSKTYTFNRQLLIAAFNANGLDGVNQMYEVEITRFEEKIKG